MIKRKISKKRKSDIMVELSAPGCVISQLAKLHGVAKSTLHKWRKENGDDFKRAEVVQPVSLENNFIKLSITDGQRLNLQKISLAYSDFSISIDGVFSSGKLISILKALEEQC